jgi:aminoglycoside phosphotransferase (APT) family kinase protein
VSGGPAETEKAKRGVLRRMLEAGAAAAGREGRVLHLARLAGGASKESWAFDLDRGDGAPLPLVARIAPDAARFAAVGTVSLATEAALQTLAGRHGVPVPGVVFTLPPGPIDGYVVRRIAGETVGPRILGSESLAAARPDLAARCGAILARIHAIPLDEAPVLERFTPLEAVAALDRRYGATERPRPMFELALRWLRDELADAPAPALLHGDFRNGNLIVGEDGIRAVLDWETAHVGAPAEDLGWLCVTSWRFGRPDLPVGGFGTREALLAAYHDAGGTRIDPHMLHVWEAFGTLRWGVMCAEVAARFRDGVRSVEGAMIARRASETEFDLARLILGACDAG